MTTRRVVTGHDAAMRSRVVHDGPTPGRLDAGWMVLDEIWVDDPDHPDPAAARDPVDCEIYHLEPPVNGSLMRVFTVQPETWQPVPTEEEIAAAYARFDTGDAVEADGSGRHTTRTIDYVVVLSGEVDLELDEGAVHLRPGDVVVQRGTRHAWHNHGTAPCVMAAVLVSSPSYR